MRVTAVSKPGIARKTAYLVRIRVRVRVRVRVKAAYHESLLKIC